MLSLISTDFMKYYMADNKDLSFVLFSNAAHSFNMPSSAELEFGINWQ